MLDSTHPRGADCELADYALIGVALSTTRRKLVPECWHRGAPAVDVHGREIDPDAPECVAWCVQSALLRHMLEGDNITVRAAIQLLHEAANTLSEGRHDTLFAFNDAPTTCFADIDRLLAVAIADAARRATNGDDLPPARDMPARLTQSKACSGVSC